MQDPQEVKFLMVQAELDANAWLERELHDRFDHHEKDIAAYTEREIQQMLQKRGQHFDPLSISVRVQERLNDYQGILGGRLPRPVFRQLYLLAYKPLVSCDLRRICAEVEYAFEPVNFHYRRDEDVAGNTVPREFPQSFLRDYLVHQMKGDISKGSANKLLILMSLLGLVSRVPAVTGGSGLAARFDQEFKTLIDQWLELRQAPNGSSSGNGPDSRKNTEEIGSCLDRNDGGPDEFRPGNVKNLTAISASLFMRVR